MSLEAVMEELKKDYIDSLSSKKTDIKELFAEKNFKGLKDVFHKLKGTGATYGVPEISVLGGTLEKLCESVNPELDWVIPEILGIMDKIQNSRRESQEFDIETHKTFQRIQSLVKDV